VIPEEPEGFVDTMAATPEEEATEESSAGESE
jgi:hypothetical protein